MSKHTRPLNQDYVSTGPVPPAFQPKIVLRVSCGRSKQIMEVAVDIPVEGESCAASALAHQKLDDILTRLGILAAGKTSTEQENAKGNLQAEEESQKSA